jgi:hypothetical protein
VSLDSAAIGRLSRAAVVSGDTIASRFGTSSPITTERNVMTPTTITVASVPAHGSNHATPMSIGVSCAIKAAPLDAPASGMPADPFR